MRKYGGIVGLCLLLFQPLRADVTCNNPGAGFSLHGTSVLKVKQQLNVTNGLLQQGANATLEGVAINLSTANLVQQNGINSNVTGVLNPNTNQLSLSSTKITSQPGAVKQTVAAAGNCTLEGIPSNFTNPTGIALANPSSTLSVAVSTPISTNIGLGGGTVQLNGATKFTAGSSLTGNGALEFNNNSLSLGGAPQTIGGSLKLKSAHDLIFNSKVTLTGELIFDKDAHVSGNGSILDMSLGGTIAIRPNTNVGMSNLVLKGLGLGQLLFYDTTSTLSLSNVQVILDRNYTITIGSVYMDGPTNVITGNFTLTFAQEGSATVDGIALTYDTLKFPDQNNIQPLAANDPSQKNLTLLNDGIVRPWNSFNLMRSNSNTELFLSKNDSNTIVFLKNSAATPQLLGLVRANSRLASNNSNAINQLAPIVRGNSRWLRTTSNAMQFGLKNLSNALLYGDRNNSNTLLFLDRNDSNTKLFLARNLSNALVFGFRTTSNALLGANRYDSNAINQLAPIVRGNSRWLRTTSNALLFGLKNISNALLFGDRNFSNAMIGLVQNVSILANNLISNSSNFYLTLLRTTSNSVVYLYRTDSNAIVRLNDQLQNVFGPTTTSITTDNYILRNDIFLSVDHLMSIAPASGNSCLIDGNGHTVHFAAGASSILSVAAGTNVLFRNTVFQNYNDDAFSLGAAARVVFGDGTRLELNDAQTLQRNMMLNGSTEIRGFGNILDLAASKISVLPHGTLSLQNVSLFGVAGTNINCAGPTSSLILKDSNLCIDSQYNFTSGSILFGGDVYLRGSGSKFFYQSNVTSTIDSCSKLTLDDLGIYYQPPVANRDLIFMTDPTSILFMTNGSSLNSTFTGIRLTNGTLMVEGKNHVGSFGSAASQATAFGNGNAANDLTVLIQDGSSLEVFSGGLDYQNVN